MINPGNVRAVASKLLPVLKEITESRMYSEFTFLRTLPDAPCQYWEYVLDFLTDGGSDLIHTCGYFTGLGELKNQTLDVNQFFKNNDVIMNHFGHLNEQGVFWPLLDPLREARTFSGLEDGVMLAVEARIQGGNAWLRDVCEETILILHEDEGSSDRVGIDCQQSERHRIKLTERGRAMFLNVPFDKVDRFKGAKIVRQGTG